MTSNEERREVAARLRALDASKWSCFGQEFDALMIASLMTACGCNFGQDWQDMELTDRLADLIEPEPERTCTMETDSNYFNAEVVVWFCSECGSPIYNDIEPSFCLYCGAMVAESKVVE